jgi:hypothetical protein
MGTRHGSTLHCRHVESPPRPAEGGTVPRNRTSGSSPRRNPGVDTGEEERPFQSDERSGPYPRVPPEAAVGPPAPCAALLGRRHGETMGGEGTRRPLVNAGSNPRPSGSPSGLTRRTHERMFDRSGEVKSRRTHIGDVIGESCLSGRSGVQSRPSIRQPIRRLSGSGGRSRASGWLARSPPRGKWPIRQSRPSVPSRTRNPGFLESHSTY